MEDEGVGAGGLKFESEFEFESCPRPKEHDEKITMLIKMGI